MFEGQPQEELEAMMKSDAEFRQLLHRHRELDKQVLDAELGVLPLDDNTLVAHEARKALRQGPAASDVRDEASLTLPLWWRRPSSSGRRHPHLPGCGSGFSRDPVRDGRSRLKPPRGYNSGSGRAHFERPHDRPSKRTRTDRRDADRPGPAPRHRCLRAVPQARMHEPRRLDQGPHRPVDDRGRGKARRDQARRHPGRRHRRQHRHRPGAGRPAEGLQADPGRARQDEPREDLQPARPWAPRSC